MAVRHMRLAVGIFFLVIGAVLLALRFVTPDLVAKFDPMRIFLGGILAMVLGCWNLAKWYMGWMWFQKQATPVRRPLQPNPMPRREEEPNPDFDFSKQDEPQDKPTQ
jgi:hypothetical protein